MLDTNQQNNQAAVTADGPIQLADSSSRGPTLERPGAIDRARASGTPEVHLSDYFRVVYKRRWLAGAAFTLVFGSTVIYTFTAERIYEARAQLLIENENPNVVSFQEVMEQNNTTADYYQTQYRLLQSRALAKRTLEASNLWNHPEFTNTADQRVSLRRLLASAFGSTSEAPGVGAVETGQQARVIDAFLRGLAIAPVKNSRLVDIKYSAADPQLAANAANALAKAFIEQNLEFKFTTTQEATDFLKRHMAEQRKAVEAHEIALHQYRESNDAVSLEDRQNIVVQRLADLNAAVTKARTERIEKEATYNQIRSVSGRPAALDTIPAILASGFIQNLKIELAHLQRQEAQLEEKLGERHPEMIKVRSAIENTQAKLRAEVGKVVQSTRTQYQSALDQERSLTSALDQQKAEAMAMNRSAIEYGVLQRDAAASRQLYDGLLQRTKETGIAGELRTSNIRVTDPAETPRRPSSPNRKNDVALGIFVGCFIAIALALLSEYLDNRIKSPDELKLHLGLPFLAMVPALKRPGPRSMTVPNNATGHDFREAFKALRTNVLFGFPDAPSKSLVVTSTGPGEGKTAVAANLAMALGLAGQRVLLIDADMRRPTAHALVGCRQEPGLSNAIVGKAKASDCVQKTRVTGLSFLGAGKIPPNPAELLASRQGTEVLASLRDHFEWIIIDSPPVLAVADSAILAHSASAVLFVVGSEMTDRSAARAALEQLDAVGAAYVGAVLNKVQLARDAYYYSRYYRREYSGYYAARSTS